MEIIISFAGILLFSFVLIKSADLTVVSLKLIGSRTKTGLFALSALVLAVGTSLPELSVAFTSAMEGSSNLSLGVVLGSNIANISLVAGAAAMFAGRVSVTKNYLKRDALIALIASLAPMLLILDGGLSRVDGFVLLAIYASYASSFFKKQYSLIAEGAIDETALHSMLRKFTLADSKRNREYGKLFVGIALLLLSSNMIVRFSKMFAAEAGIPVFLVGLFILAIGTSLPELAFSFRSLKDREPSMFLGNLLGSTIANSTLIIGVATVLSPLEVHAVNEYITAVLASVVIYGVFWFFIRTKKELNRPEAAILLLLYVAFIVVEFIVNRG
jgi:cation:H+ antiporter